MPEDVTPEPSNAGIREAVTQAYDKVTSPVEAPPAAPPAAEPVQKPRTDTTKPPEPGESSVAKPPADGRDEKGRFAPKPKSSATQVSEPGATSGTEPPEPGETVETKPPEPAVKPPASWTPSAREEWGKLPATVQAEVSKRERETARVLQESTEARKSWGQFREAVAPYEAMVRAEGSDPIRAAVGLMQQAALLRTGAPQQKAHFVAQLIQAHGVDVGMLDQVLRDQLAGGASQGAQQGPQTYRDPEFQAFKQQLAATAHQRQEQDRTKAMSEVQSFAEAHEFFDDVRDDVADILEVSKRRGLQLSLEDAYTRAIKLHPDISKVMEQREAAKAAANAQASTQRAKAAGVSVRPEPAAQGISAQPKSLRGDIEAALEKVSKR